MNTPTRAYLVLWRHVKLCYDGVNLEGTVMQLES